MKTTYKISTKRTYIEPKIERIELDHEISLVLESPKKGPWEGVNSQEHFNEDPFKANLA